MKLILPGIPPSKKNGRIIIHGKGGRHFDIPSNEYQKWEKSMQWHVAAQWKNSDIIDFGIRLELIFHVVDKTKWDLSNKAESIQDLLKVCHVIKDDNRFIIQATATTWVPSESDFVEILITHADHHGVQGKLPF